MPEIKLKIDDLVLDTDNPRITHAEGQQQALQKVVKDQKGKLIKLAESIVERGFSPIEKFMVMEVSAKPRRYVALEGNRRVAVVRLLTNPAVMTGLVMPPGMQRPMEELAKIFVRSNVEPIDAFEVGSREEGRYWIELRHNGEDEGRGVVGWKPITAARWRKKEPAIQAFDLVMEHGGFTEDLAEDIRAGFSLTTLRRLLDSKDVRAELGLDVENGQLTSPLLGSEIIKPLKRMILDIASKSVNSRKFNKTEKMLEYVRKFKSPDRPDFSKKVPSRPVEGIQKAEFTKQKATTTQTKRSSVPDRKQIVPKNCQINVSSSRISEIYKELKTLKLDEANNAIAVLMRVFLELSVDHFLEQKNISLTFPVQGQGEKDKRLDKKLAEAVEIMVSAGVPKRNLDPILRSISVQRNPLNIDLLHMYVHNRFATPIRSELTAAWDQAQPLFEKIWP